MIGNDAGVGASAAAHQMPRSSRGRQCQDQVDTSLLPLRYCLRAPGRIPDCQVVIVRVRKRLELDNSFKPALLRAAQLRRLAG